MTTVFLKTIVFLITLLSAACAEDSQSKLNRASTSRNEKPASDDSHRDENILELTASVYEGRDLHGEPCTLFISKNEETQRQDHQDHGEETTEPAILAKLAYTLHGIKPIDVAVDFYRYNPGLNKFFDRDSGESGTNLVLLSVLLDNEQEFMDPNKLLEYEQQGHLVQSLRIDFHDNEKDIEKAVIKIKHFGHYDASACLGFQLTGTQKVNFSLSLSDNDHGNHEENHHDNDHEEQGHHHETDEH